MSERFTGDALPPFEAPQGVLAWIELPTGNVYLQPDYTWIDYNDPVRSRILNNCLKVLRPGPAEGSGIAYCCMFARAFYGQMYEIKQRILDNLDDTETVY